MNDPALPHIEAARRGNPEAAEQLVEQFHRPVYAYLRRLAGSDSDAVELTQQTFCRVWQALPSFACRSTVSSWIHGIAYRTFVDWLRRERRNVPQTDAWWRELRDNGPSPDRSAVLLDDRAVVFAAVERLDADIRNTIHLHYFQGLTIEETAAALDIATSTVKYRVRQALADLQQAVGNPAPRRDTTSTPPVSLKFPNPQPQSPHQP